MLRHLTMWLLLGLVCVANSASAAEKTIQLDLGSGVRLDLVLIEKGTFLQGSPESEKGRGEDETQREVTLSQDFYLGKYPITRKQFAEFVKQAKFKTESESGPSGGFGWEGNELKQKKEYTWKNPGFAQSDDHPVTLVTYDDALAFIKWASGKTKQKLTLPTEAQWEYAARAGSTTAYPGGDDERHLAEVGWYKANANDGTRPLGQKAANAWGLFDMHGNTYEWCRDWFAPYDAGPLTDPEQKQSNLSDKPRRVLRGGAFHKDARHGRSAARYRNDPKSRNADNGFRVALQADEAAIARPPVVKPVEPTPPTPPVKPTLPVEPNPPAIPTPPEPPIAPPLPTMPDAHGHDHADHGHGHDHGEHVPAPPAGPALHKLPFSFGLGGVCCCALAALLIVAVPAFFLMKMLGGGGSHDGSYVSQDVAPQKPVYNQPLSPAPIQPPPSSGSARVRFGDDGFWIDVTGIEPQSTVEYRYTAQGSSHFENFVVTGADRELFIYTGSRPASAEVLNILPPGGGPGGGITSRPGAPSSSPMRSGPIIVPPLRTPPPPRHRNQVDEPFRGYPSAY